MSRIRNLDQRFVDAAFGPGSRTLSVAAEAVFVVLLAWLHGPGGWMACATAALCGAVAGWIDRSSAQAHWTRLSRITIRELAERGRDKCLPPHGPARRLLALLGLVAGAALLVWRSPRGAVAIALSVPFLYVALLLGRDLVLAAAPPRGPKRAV